MKIQKIQTQSINNNRQNPAPASFKGADGLIMFWDAIGRGGWTANFILQDVCGNNLPRTTISLNRNKKELGHLNYAAATETFLRESLSGPSMVAIPLAVMAAATGLAGKAVKVPVKNIADFSEIMKATLADAAKNGADINKDALRTNFYTNILNAVGEHSLGGVDEAFTKDALGRISQIESGKLPKRNFFQKLLDKPLKSGAEAKDQTIANMQKVFNKLRQQKANYGDDFLSAKIAKDGKDTQFADLTAQMKGYFDDFAKKHFKAGSETGNVELPKNIDTLIDKFKNLRTGQRFATGIAMTGLMMAFLSIVPKIYSRSKTNPEEPVGQKGQASEEVAK